MEALWHSDDPQVWQSALDALPDRIAAHGKEGYAELDAWFFDELPERLLESCEERCISGEDLVLIVQWKLKRGTWRPKLLDYARNLQEEEVRSASRQAFATIRGAKEKDEKAYIECCAAAMAILTKLKGVGPATASAVLTAADTSFPYMADEAMDISLDKQREYTVKRYVEYAALLRKKAEQLDGSVGEASKGTGWTAKAVERAMQSEELAYSSAAKKRRRTAS